jgi:hypothetical protein
MLFTLLALADEQSRSERSDFVQRWTLLVRSLRVWAPTLAVVGMLGVCPRLTEAMPDRQDRSRIHHEVVELVTERAFAITCDYNAAPLDRTHDLHLLQADMAAVGFTPSGAMGVKTAKGPSLTIPVKRAACRRGDRVRPAAVHGRCCKCSDLKVAPS